MVQINCMLKITYRLKLRPFQDNPTHFQVKSRPLGPAQSEYRYRYRSFIWLTDTDTDTDTEIDNAVLAHPYCKPKDEYVRVIASTNHLEIPCFVKEPPLIPPEGGY